MQYFVVMIDYGRRGREAIVDPEITRREVISRVLSGEYRNISFIHEIAGSSVDDITAEILAEAAVPDPDLGADLQAGRFDHARDLRKHELFDRSEGRAGRGKFAGDFRCYYKATCARLCDRSPFARADEEIRQRGKLPWG
jgi:hypothetical protein